MLNYLLWNLFVIGTLTAGYMLKIPTVSGVVVGIIYTLNFIFYIIGVLTYSSSPLVKEKFDKQVKESKMFIIIPLEVLYIAITIYLGYKKISAIMIANFLFMIYAHYSIKNQIRTE